MLKLFTVCFEQGNFADDGAVDAPAEAHDKSSDVDEHQISPQGVDGRPKYRKAHCNQNGKTHRLQLVRKMAIAVIKAGQYKGGCL